MKRCRRKSSGLKINFYPNLLINRTNYLVPGILNFVLGLGTKYQVLFFPPFRVLNIFLASYGTRTRRRPSLRIPGRGRGYTPRPDILNPDIRGMDRILFLEPRLPSTNNSCVKASKQEQGRPRNPQLVLASP